LHELLISLAVENIGAIDPANADKTLYDFHAGAASMTAENAFDVETKPEDLINHIFASFSAFENYGMYGEEQKDKSVNAHNCRKSCIMSKLFVLHKMVAIANCDIGLAQEIKNLFIKYSKAYIELTSVVSDL